MMMRSSLVILPLLATSVHSFGVLDPASLSHAMASVLHPHAAHVMAHHVVAHNKAPLDALANAMGTILHPSVTTTVAPPTTSLLSPITQPAQHLLQNYQTLLQNHPLTTKMMTGATLATCGDAIAQSKENSPYDTRRAASFATFDMAYRALQHVSFPMIVATCQGQFLTSLAASMGIVSLSPEITQNLAALEQTLASQLGIVPFLYYPVFFALTGSMQGLSTSQSVERAQEKFLPLMQRNLLFWIPVQFVQFGMVPEDLQIPFLSVCGLAWTFILSVMAGSVAKTTNSEEEVALAAAATTEVASVDAIAIDDNDNNTDIDTIPTYNIPTTSNVADTMAYEQR